MGLRKFLGDLFDARPWLSVTIEDERSGKSITLFHHQAEPSEVEQAVREVMQGAAKGDASAIKITIGEAKWLSDQLR